VIFEHVRRLPETTPSHIALTRSGRTHDDGTQWRRPRRRPGCIWVRLLEADTGLKPLTICGTLPVTVILGGRYDPPPVKRFSE